MTLAEYRAIHPRRPIEEETSESSLKEAVGRYVDWQAHTGRKHPVTAKTLRPLAQSLQRWLAAMGADRPIKELTLPDVEDYLAILRSAGLKDQSVKTQFAMIRAFFTWLLNRNYVLHDSMFKAGGKFAMTAPDVKEEIYDVYTSDELTRLYEAISEVDKSNRYRNRAIFSVLLGSGVRLGELANLDDEDFSGEFLRIRDPKNRTPRFVPITGVVQDAIREYQSKRRAPERGAAEREPLFLGEEGTRLSETGITKVIQRLKVYADGGLQKPMVAGVHKFRHTYATYTVIRERQLKGDCNIWELSRRLGHKSIKITERYLTLTDPSLKVPEPWSRYIFIASGDGGERRGAAFAGVRA